MEDIHRNSGMVMVFMGKSKEEVEVWRNLLAILHHQQGETRRRSFMKRLQGVRYCRNRGKGVKIRIANTYHSLGTALIGTGKLNRAASQLEESLEMKRAIYGHRKPHRNIAQSLNNFGCVYLEMGELGKAQEKYEQNLEMARAIHLPHKQHCDIACSLKNLGIVYHRKGKLEKALQKLEQSLKMYRAIHGHRKPHPCIAMSLDSLGIMYQRMGKLEKALEKHKHSLEMFQAIHGHRIPHPRITSSLDHLGIVYRDMGILDKALEKHQQSLDMLREIHKQSGPHPQTAKSLQNIELVHHMQKNLKEEASISLYLVGLVNTGLDPQTWTSSGAYEFVGVTFKYYNAIPKIDVVVDLKLPGSTSAHAVDSDAEQDELNDVCPTLRHAAGSGEHPLYSCLRVTRPTLDDFESTSLTSTAAAAPNWKQVGRSGRSELPTTHCNSSIAYCLVNYFLSFCRYDRVVNFFSSDAVSTTCSDALVHIATAHRLQGDIKNASACIDEALRRNPTSAMAWLGRARIAKAQGNMEDTLEAATKAWECESAGIAEFIVLAAVCAELKKYQDAFIALNSSNIPLLELDY